MWRDRRRDAGIPLTTPEQRLRNAVYQAHRQEKTRRARLLAKTGIDHVPDGMKWCNTCGQYRAFSEFHKHSNTTKHTDGLRSECRGCTKALNARRHNREWHKDYNLRKRFGITFNEYAAILLSQGGKCAICGRPNGDDVMGHSLAVDHDHVTNEVRGLLCRHCNIGLGKLGDSIAAIERVLIYLKTPPARCLND